jgi:two-component system sensor histidine kinase VanS
MGDGLQIRGREIKYSIRNQLALIFIGMTLLSVAVIAVINGFFLEEYYISKKMIVLKEAYSSLDSFDVELDQASAGEMVNVPVPSELKKSSWENNLTWIITNQQGQALIYNVQERDVDRMEASLFGYQTGIDEERKEVLRRTDHYVIQKSLDRTSSMRYLELWGEFSNGNSCMIRSPLESIRESAAISNMFYIYVGIVIIIVSGIIIWLITNHLTKPISELTAISQRMAALDFHTKYRSRHSNEVDLLGENFNRMSEQLERTILKLQTANKQLEQDIAEKVKIDEMRKEFLNNVSHELKTPIALIQGYAEGLKDNIMDDVESREFYCEVIMDESSKMNIMVKKLLTLNKLEFGYDELLMERFDIIALIKGLLQNSEILIQQREARIQFDENQAPVYVRADEFKIEEVVTNFFTNALNHLDYERIVAVNVYRQGDKARVAVFNTGNPIPEDALEHVWEKFYKVDKAHTREYGGSGIGLSIVKAIMESHHERCGVENCENGVMFWFELPLEE